MLVLVWLDGSAKTSKCLSLAQVAQVRVRRSQVFWPPMCGSSGGGQALTRSRESGITQIQIKKSVSQEILSCETIFDGNVQGSRGVITAHRWRLNEVVTLIVGCECWAPPARMQVFRSLSFSFSLLCRQFSGGHLAAKKQLYHIQSQSINVNVLDTH